MLLHPVISQLQTLNLHCMAKMLKEQEEQPQLESFSFTERLGLLVDMEITARDSRRLQNRLRKAKLKHEACMEDIDYQAARGIDKNLLATLAQCQWVASHHHLLIVGPCGTGKTFLACALAHKACLNTYTASIDHATVQYVNIYSSIIALMQL